MLRRFAQASMTVVAVVLSSGTGSPAFSAPATPASLDAGTWDLSFEKGNRRCRLFLRSEPKADAFALAMPAVCHKAFPALAGTTSWAVGSGDRIAFRSDAGQTAIEFQPDGSGSLAAQVGDGDIYLLTPINPVQLERLRSAPTIATTPAATAATGEEGILVNRTPVGAAGKKAQDTTATAMLPPTTVVEVAGNYAVLRQDRDTGCMVSLEPSGAKGARARLAPACRDQGIVIFDPAAWKLVGGTELVLTARRGHTTALKRQDEKTWANAPTRGAPLVLKRL